MRLTKIFAIAGLDGRSIGSKILITFSYRLTENARQQNVSSTFKTKPSFGTCGRITEYPAIANT